MEFTIENGVLIKYSGDDKIINIPESVTEIGDNAFWMNKTVEEIRFPESIAKIGREAFRWCDNLQKVIFSEGIAEIDDLAFYGCPKLKTVEFPRSLRRINHMAFAFTGIKNIIVPSTVEYFSSDAFHMLVHPLYTNENEETFLSKTDSGFNSNDVVCLKKGVLEKYTPCRMFDQEEEIYVPQGVKGIGNTAFDKAIIGHGFNRWETKKIYIPESVTQIGKLTFNKCKDIVICAKAGSYAEKYAKARGLIFEETDY